jgi:hypothetical protein
MRFYSLSVTNPNNGDALWIPDSVANINFGQGISLSSRLNGVNLMGAMDIDFSFLTLPQGIPKPFNSWMRIKGVSLADISQAANLTPYPKLPYQFKFYAGFRAPGLPLEDPTQSSNIMAQGWITECFGNAQGTDRSLELSFAPGPIQSRTLAKEIVLDLQPNVPMGGPLQAALLAAYPANTKVVVDISNEIKWPTAMQQHSPTLSAFANAIRRRTREQQFQKIKTYSGALYDGVEIFIAADGTVTARDDHDPGTTAPAVVTPNAAGGVNVTATQPVAPTPTVKPPPTIDINYHDIVGQPTWVSMGIMQIKLVMRTDIEMLSYLNLPPRLANEAVISRQGVAGGFTAGINGLTNVRDPVIFKNKFLVRSVAHYGSFRGVNAEAWVTVIEAMQPNAQTQPASTPTTTAAPGTVSSEPLPPPAPRPQLPMYPPAPPVAGPFFPRPELPIAPGASPNNPNQWPK